MPHNADDILGEVDWDEWPDFELFGSAEGDDSAPTPDDEAAA
jgi:hypothetical protein